MSKKTEAPVSTSFLQFPFGDKTDVSGIRLKTSDGLAPLKCFIWKVGDFMLYANNTRTLHHTIMLIASLRKIPMHALCIHDIL